MSDWLHTNLWIDPATLNLAVVLLAMAVIVRKVVAVIFEYVVSFMESGPREPRFR